MPRPGKQGGRRGVRYASIRATGNGHRGSAAASGNSRTHLSCVRQFGGDGNAPPEAAQAGTGWALQAAAWQRPRPAQASAPATREAPPRGSAGGNPGHRQCQLQQQCRPAAGLAVAPLQQAPSVHGDACGRRALPQCLQLTLPDRRTPAAARCPALHAGRPLHAGTAETEQPAPVPRPAALLGTTGICSVTGSFSSANSRTTARQNRLWSATPA